MIYYVLGLITSTIVFSVLLAVLQSPIDGQYLWMAVFSLTLLSAVTTLIFLIGLSQRMVQTVRQHNQHNPRRATGGGALPSLTTQPLPSSGASLTRSEFARYWAAQHDTPAGEQTEPVAVERGSSAIRRWLQSEIEKSASKNAKPDTNQLPGFESIKRH